MQQVKDEVRVLGIDDTGFDFEDEEAQLVGCVFRGGKFLEGVIMRPVTVDGGDATDQIIDMVNNSAHRDQIQVVILDGVAFAGFNICNKTKLVEETGKAFIATTRTEPDLESMQAAMQHVTNPEKRMQHIKEWGDVKTVDIMDRGSLYFQHANMSADKARTVLEKTCTRSLLPEPVRVAHMIGAAMHRGESRSRP